MSRKRGSEVQTAMTIIVGGVVVLLLIGALVGKFFRGTRDGIIPQNYGEPVERSN